MSKSDVIMNQEELSKVPVQNVGSDAPAKDADFEKEAQISLDRERLTYICDYCGKVNSVDEPRCTRCGKRRPRSEYIKAINTIKEAKAAQQEFAVEEAAKQAEYEQAEKYIQEKKEQVLAEKDVAQKMAVVRLVEERVADEKQQMAVKEETRVDQEREYAKKMAAREAVLQIIAAEKYADEVIHQTKKEASQAIMEKDAEQDKLKSTFEERVKAEREKAIGIAAEKLVAERAGIERFAIEQIELNKLEVEKAANEKVLAERDESEKMAARRAVLQIIAAEKAAEDELRLNREALSRAALKRIEEERDVAQRDANAKFLAERQGIERAAEERIRAEREAVKKLLEERKSMDASPYGQMPDAYAQTKQVVQPFVIVPYVNTNQPLLQYKPNQVYRFVPNTFTEQYVAQEKAKKDLQVMVEGPRPTEQEIEQLIAIKKNEKQAVEAELDMLSGADKNTDKYKNSVRKGKLRTRLTSLFITLFILGLGALLWFLPLLPKVAYDGGNLNLITGFAMLIQDGVNGVIGTELAFITSNSFVEFIRELDFMGGVVLPFGLCLALITYVVLLIKSIIRLITGNAGSKGVFLPVLALVFVQIAVAGIYLLAKPAGFEFFADLQYAVYGLEGLSIAVLICSLFAKKNKEKAPK
ncbi:MAG: hypothetical protein PHC84_04525 [Clostridia bacterium]|nr:hypothetical protein [Clostridia bacterium]